MVGLLALGISANADNIISDKLTASSFGISGTVYKSVSYTSTETGIAYSGQMAGDKSSIQLRSKNSNSGIVVTKNDKGYILESIEFEWNSATSNSRVLDVYGNSEAFSAPTDLYNTTATKLGSVSCGSVSLTNINGEYSYIGIRSNDGAIYLTSIIFNWIAPGEVEEPAVAKPVIEVVEDEGYALVGITCDTEGAEIYYTLDGSTPSKESDKYTEEFFIYESCTIKAVAYVGEDASSVATEVVTLPFVLEDFSNLFDVELENNQTLDVVINANWTPMKVIYENGKYMIVNCGYNNMLFYSNTAATTPRNNGDTFNRAEGKFQIYNNQRELTNYTISEITAGDPVNPTPVESEDIEYTIATYNMYQYFTLQGMTISGINGKNATATDADGNEVEVKLYNQFGIEGFEEAENVDITGFVGIFGDNLQFWPVTILPAQVEITVPEGAHNFEAKEVVDGDDVNIKISGVHAESELYYRFTAKGEENKEPEVEAYAVDHEGFTKSENCTLEEDGTYTHVIPVTEPGTFEIYTYHAASDTQSEVKVLEAGATTGIELIGADNDAEAEYFNLQGIRVDNPENGLYIVRKAGKTFKVVK